MPERVALRAARANIRERYRLCVSFYKDYRKLVDPAAFFSRLAAIHGPAVMSFFSR